MASALADGKSARWADLGRRTASALLLAPAVLGIIWYGGPVFDIAVGAVVIALWHEWAELCRRDGSAGLLAAGLAWIALAGAGFVWLRGDPVAGRANVVFLLLLVWASDIGAYLAGRAIGGPRLAPMISPGKTWAGAAGGVLGAAAMGLIAAWLLSPSTSLARAMAIAAVLSVIGQVGDLVESLAKRRFGVKNSGRLIPGHGGALDRLDALLAVIPVAWLLAYLRGRGLVLW